MTTYSFRLYIAGESARSQAAETNLRMICCGGLSGDFDIEIIDVVEHPELARNERIIATPTAIRLAPPPQLRVIGDLSELGRAAALLGIPAPARPPTEG